MEDPQDPNMAWYGNVPSFLGHICRGDSQKRRPETQAKNIYGRRTSNQSVPEMAYNVGPPRWLSLLYISHHHITMIDDTYDYG